MLHQGSHENSVFERYMYIQLPWSGCGLIQRMYAVHYPLGCWLFVATESGEVGFTCHSMNERALHKYLLAWEGAGSHIYMGDGTMGQNTDKRPHPQRTDEMHPVLCAHQAWAPSIRSSVQMSLARFLGTIHLKLCLLLLRDKVAVPARLVVLVCLCPSSRWRALALKGSRWRALAVKSSMDHLAMNFDHEDQFVEKLLRWMHDFVATKDSLSQTSDLCNSR